ncbi:MAG: nitrite reductase [Candidatus Thermoplasmatota archaeon]|jgi:AcrR family transcriptional regulator|nr:nitrite reductase [Candidatus Thermoplasmatota archaeon]MCL5438172.1 nitrite reductase [Candidatus Thermoplasmatota archaeon]
MVDPKIDTKVHGFLKTLPSEELFFEAVRDLMKDLIKEFLKKRINSDPELKELVIEALKGFIDAKLREYGSMAKMAKLTAKVGLNVAPSEIKDEALNNIMETFQSEIEEIIRKTL